MPAPRDSKSLAERIDINYWRQPHPLRQFKWWLSGAAVMVAAGWLIFAVVSGNQRIFSAGPLSVAHSMFENDCATCHTRSWQPAVRLASGDSRRRSVPNEACLACHDGPIHQQKEIAADVPSCAECHREHRGSTTLARVPDSQCVKCHGDLKTSSGSTAFEPHVIHFSLSGSRVGDHPEFGLLRRQEPDTAEIKLNHAVHLKAEGVLGPGGKPEVLTCSSCHVPDSDRRYMQPINHEQHCSRCHSNSLTFDTEKFAGRPAPHREPAVVRAVMRQRYSEFARLNSESLNAESPPAPPRRVPGRPATQPLSKQGRDWVQQQLDQAERVLFDGAGGCRYCHSVQPGDSDWKIAPPKIPNRWLSHSTFRHDSHRMLGCTQCHERATASTVTREVLLPSIETCRQCHGRKNGARGDCVECHEFHDKSRERDFNGSHSIGRLLP